MRTLHLLYCAAFTAGALAANKCSPRSDGWGTFAAWEGFHLTEGINSAKQYTLDAGEIITFPCPDCSVQVRSVLLSCGKLVVRTSL